MAVTPDGTFAGMDKIDASALTGVSETALLTLNGRAHQARHADAIIDDPEAIRLVDAIDFDFAKFGRTGQEMAVRSLAFDRAAVGYLSTHPAATVVALAEGFQTSFWRLNRALPDADFRWVTVDFEPIVELRQRLLPPSPRITNLAQSALDYSWMDRIDTDNGVFITAEGLLMYLQPEEAMGLITECAKRFPGGQMVFDLPPTLVKKFAPKRYARHPALPGAADAFQPVGQATRRPGEHGPRYPRGARPADAARAAAWCSRPCSRRSGSSSPPNRFAGPTHCWSSAEPNTERLRPRVLEGQAF